MAARDPRSAAIRRVLLITLALNLVVAAAKIVFGAWTGSLAIASDGIHSVIDAGVNVIGLFTMRAAAAPPDAEHPYGHGKIEIVAAAGIGIAVGVTAVRFAWNAIESLMAGGTRPDTPALGYGVVLGTLAINLFVATYETRRGRALDSQFLQADAAHTGSDVIVTCAVLAAYTGARYGLDWADAVGTLLVVLFIGRIAWTVLASNLGVLVDQAVIDPARVRALAVQVPGVVGCHRVRSRGTARHVQLDLHIHVDGEQSLASAHEIAHRVEDAIRAAQPEVIDVTVHMEPEGDAEEDL
ncbi:MAG TPA: cation diffusion facilitator family transporter [Kofleriaceae bacterium]|jgi:cation diffusion facilitator family transporter|nr:cation diffusion facilitator family transporter [Kofleriaceae bacterium]